MKSIGKWVSGWKLVVLSIWIAGASQLAAEPALDGQQRQEAVESINKLLAENYVYPETAAEMAAVVTKKLASGGYDQIDDPDKFAQLLTEDLLSVSHDKHLRVMYAPEMVKRMRARQEGNDEPSRERMLRGAQRSNFAFEELRILDGNVGYLKFNGFSGLEEAGETAVAAMNFLAHCDALIIDMRENGGGSPRMIQLVSSYFFDGDPVHLNSFYWRPRDETTQTWTLPYVPGKKLSATDLYVLTSGRTFSAAEEFTYNLKNLKRATIVGETTGGGAHPGGTMVANDDFMVWVPQGRAINPISGTNWEGTGVTPDIEVTQSEALERAHTAALERLLVKTEEDDLKAAYQWALDGLRALQTPHELSPARQQEVVGQYGPRKISWSEKDGLTYQRDSGPVYHMLAMGDDLFRFRELDNFRLRVLRKDDRIIGLEGLYPNGQTDRTMR